MAKLLFKNVYINDITASEIDLRQFLQDYYNGKIQVQNVLINDELEFVSITTY